MNIFSSYTLPYLTYICVVCTVHILQYKVNHFAKISLICVVSTNKYTHTHTNCVIYMRIYGLSKGFMRTYNKKTYILKFRGGGE